MPLQKILLLILCAINLNGQHVFAQQIIAAASLSGHVTDANRASLGGVAITVTSLDTNQTQTVLSSADGQFRFAYLPVGNYTIQAARTGFEPIKQKFTASVGQLLDITLQLNVAALAAQVNIATENALNIETARTQIAETILPRDVENLPLNGRNYLDLALLVPGVSRTNTGSVQRFAETSAVPGTGISIAGQRNLNNSFIVDGSSANDDAADLTGTYYSQEVIREFQVVTSGAVAEFGRASSGFVNIITQSGTNNYRGKIYGFLRSDKFDARNTLAASKDSLTQTQYGASFSGKIIQNRTFFFANFEQTRRNDANVITILPASAAVINKKLDQVNYRGPRVETGLVPGGFDATNFFARVDHNPDRRNLFFATYSFYDINAQNARTVGGLNAVSRGTNLDNKDHTVNASNVTTFGSEMLNEFRFQFRRSRLNAPVNDETGPAVNISGVASFGTATFSPIARSIDLFSASDAVSATRKQHALKFGGEFLYNRVDISFPGAFQGVYTFTNLNNFLNGNYSLFQQAFGAPSQLQKNSNVGLFAQDEWKILRRLTLNLGLRYDAQFLPAPIKTDANNFAPRFGLAYAPFEKTVIRASAGIYYDRIPLRATSNALQRDGSKYVVAQLSPTAVSAPLFPNILPAAPTVLTTKPNITRIDLNIKNSQSQQANLQIEQALGGGSTVSIGYIYLRGLNLILSRNVNVPRCAIASQNLCRPDPNFGNISFYEGSGDSYYHGLIVAFNKRQGTWASLRASYTLSKAIDNAGNFFFSSPQNNFDLRDDRGLSDNDQRHRLTVSGTLSAPRATNRSILQRINNGFAISYIFTYTSRLPFNVLTGNDRNGDTNFNDRPIGVARNTGRGFDFASLDVRLSRRFRFGEKTNLELLVEGFNILNRANYSIPNNVFGANFTPLASFGKPTAAFDPRQIQLGFRFNF